MYVMGDRNIQDPVRSRPYVLWTIIGLSALVFLVQVFLNGMHSSIDGASQGTVFIYTFGAIPARVANIPVTTIDLSWIRIPGWVTLFTSLFLHGDFWHILFNMWTLFVFGDNIEHALGKFGFALFYVAGGVVATLVHVIFSLKGEAALTPTIGASGAIAAVMGMYMILYPKSQVLVLALWFPIAMPAVIFMGIWFGMQIFGAFSASGNIAWWAHVGGFSFGLLVGLIYKLFVKRPPGLPTWKTGRFMRHEPFEHNDGRVSDEEDIWRH